MTINDFLPIVLFLCILTLFAVPLGEFMAKVFNGRRTFLTPIVSQIGNFWLDLTRSLVYILIPLILSGHWYWYHREWDGTNDAPALAQADVAVAMNAST